MKVELGDRTASAAVHEGVSGMEEAEGLLTRVGEWARRVLDREAGDQDAKAEPPPELPEIRWGESGAEWFRCCVCRTLPEGFRAQVDRLESDAFGAGAGKKPKKLERVAEQFCSVPNGYVVGVTGADRVVGCVLVFRRPIRYKGAPIVLGGIGGVTTDRRYRGRGVASTLMRLAMGALEELGCESALLCTDLNDDRLTRLYGGFGFVALDKPFSYSGKSGRLYVNDDGMIAPVLSEEKFRLLRDSSPTIYIGMGNF